MPIYFNSLLRQYEIEPVEVILLRHQDGSAVRGRTPYELWRDEADAFEVYQRVQRTKNRAKFSRAPYWASFVGMPDGRTLFVGLYSARYGGVLVEDVPNPHNDEVALAGSSDFYHLQLDARVLDLRGRLVVDWGDGVRAWVQRADKQDKPVLEVWTDFKEPDFPGYLRFREPLSRIDRLPRGWVDALRAASGVYLLTCPRTKEQYVGSACGADGFWGRWHQYVVNNNGGNVALKSREYSDYQVSILEVAGSSFSWKEILDRESQWKLKLQSQEMGLNKNI